MWLSYVMQAVIWGVWLGSLGLWVAPWPLPLSAAVLLAGLAPLMAVWLAVLVHEAGHALTGWALGFAVLAGGVRPGQARHTWRGWRWAWWVRPEAGLNASLGFVSQVPRHTRHLRWRVLAVYLGGPAANLLAALALSLGVAHAPATLPVWAQVWAVLLAWVNVEAALSNLWLAAQNPHADGWAVRRLTLGDGRGVLTLRQLTHLSVVRGLRPRHWPPALLHDLRASHAPLDGYAQFFYWQALDAGQIGRALVWLERCGSAGWALAERAYVLARYTPQRVTAHQLWQRSGQTHPRAEAALALAEGHVAEAHQRIEAALYNPDDTYNPGLCRAEWHALRTLRHHRPPPANPPPPPMPPARHAWPWARWLVNVLGALVIGLVLAVTAGATALMVHWPVASPPCQRAPLADAVCKITARWQVLQVLSQPPAEQVTRLEAVLAGYPGMIEAHGLLALVAPQPQALRAAARVIELARSPADRGVAYWLYAITLEKFYGAAAARSAWWQAAQAAHTPAQLAEAHHHLAETASTPAEALGHAQTAFAVHPTAQTACALAERYAMAGNRFEAVRHAQIGQRLANRPCFRWLVVGSGQLVVGSCRFRMGFFSHEGSRRSTKKIAR